MLDDDRTEQDREDADFHMAVRDTAYFLWEQAGRPAVPIELPRTLRRVRRP